MKITENPDDGEQTISLMPRTDIRGVDEVLGEIFDLHKMERLGGASGRGWSSYAQFQRCPYLYKVTYVDGVRGAAAMALETGSLFHTFMALHYTWMLDENLTLTPEVCRDALLEHGARPEAVIAGWRAYESYAIHYQNDYLLPLAIESWAQGLHGNTCRYDMIARVVEPQPGILPGAWIIEHKCLAGSEKLWSHVTNELVAVQDLFARSEEAVVQAFDVNTQKLVMRRTAVPQPTTQRDVYQVTLRSGQQLRTSDNHPFLTARGWVPASALTSNDWVALSPLQESSKSSGFNDHEVEFVGLMLGDGYMHGGKFTQNNVAVRTRFIAACTALGVDTHVRESTTRATDVAYANGEDSACRQLLERLNLIDTVATTKFVPDTLLTAPDHQVDILLGALWNTDGCVDLFEERSRLRPDDPQQKVRIAYVSRSKRLCENVQFLLQRRGYASTVTESSVEYDGARRDVWTTKIVSRASKRKFLHNVLEGRIPFVKYDVRVALDAIKPGDDRPVPSDFVRFMVADIDIPGTLRQQLKNHSVERETLNAIASPKFDAVLNAQLAWSRVAHVIVTGREMMYDITVPGVENFVCNGIITHNTAARFTADLLEGWHNDGEILGQIMVWKQAKLDKKYGKLRGTIVNIVGKQKIPQFARVIVPAQRWHVSQHEEDLKVWAALQEMYRATNTWPKARNNCVHRYGLCQLFHHCSTNEKTTTVEKLKQLTDDARQRAEARRKAKKNTSGVADAIDSIVAPIPADGVIPDDDFVDQAATTLAPNIDTRDMTVGETSPIET